MRRLLVVSFVLFVVAITSSLFAQSISESDAKNIAQNFFAKISGEPLRAVSDETNEQKRMPLSATGENNDTLYYVVNNTNKNGFVIVAADERVWPILGYSLHGEFNADNQPPAFVNWMENRKKEIEFIKQNQTLPESTVAEQWENLNDATPILKSTATSVAPLLQTTWNQGCYYNDLCPVDAAGPCGRVWAGCTATAMAQIMKYWNYPTTGTGSHSYTHPTYGTQSANFSATTYQWSQMPNNVTEANNAVATLLYHCGVAVNMNYSPTGSGAGEPSDELVAYFGYSPNAQFVEKNDYNEIEWINLLKSELNLKRPIWYDGFNPSSGHAFICDGYREDDYFHFNWGWGGYADGYFYLGSLNPAGHNYTDDQGAVIKVFPNDLPAGYNGFFISDGAIEMSAGGQIYPIDIFSSENWTATSDQSWLTFDQSNGASGKSTLVVTAVDNNTSVLRSATITISVTGFDDQTVTVTQKPKTIVTAGGLYNALLGVLETTERLVLSGTIDARDFKTMRDNMPQLKEIDLSDVTILTYTGTGGTVGTDGITYPANTIPNYAFCVPSSWAGKNTLTSFISPTSITAIGNYAFVNCIYLVSIDIPNLVSSIGGYAFYNCSRLGSIYSYKTSPVNLSSSTSVFYNVNKSTCKLYVPFGSSGLYAVADQWRDFSNIIEMSGVSLSSTTVIVDAAANSSNTVLLSSNTTWTASSNQTWLEVSPTSGTGNQELVFTAEANPNTTTRLATITVSAPGVDDQFIELTQQAAEENLVLDYLSVADTTINNIQVNCFNAVETITVAGEPSNVFISNGATVNFIAGRSIVFLPGFYAEAGSNVHAYITTDATFCTENGGGILQNPIAEKSVIINNVEHERSPSNDFQKMIKVFPNPNNGSFVLELKNFDETAKVYIYSILGSVVYENVVREQSLLEIDIQHLNKGLYFVKVIDGNQSLTNKMIVN